MAGSEKDYPGVFKAPDGRHGDMKYYRRIQGMLTVPRGSIKPQPAKTFEVPDSRSGNKLDRFLGFYNRVLSVTSPKIDRAGDRDRAEHEGRTATDRRRYLSGLWNREEKYVWSGREERKENGEETGVFRRVSKSQSNIFRKKDVFYHENGMPKQVNRRILGGFLKSGRETDADGQVLSRMQGDFIGHVKQSKSKDGKKLRFEQEDLFGLFGRKQVSHGLPDGSALMWRTMERHVGPYRMQIIPDKAGHGETRSRSMGGLFKRETHYDFERGTKTTKYRALFGLRIYEKEKPIPIGDKEMQAYEKRLGQNEAADLQWSKHAAGLDPSDGQQTSKNAKEAFAQALEGISRESGRGRDDRTAAWVSERVEQKERIDEKGQSGPNRLRRSATSASQETAPPAYNDVVSVSPLDSASLKGVDSKSSAPLRDDWEAMEKALHKRALKGMNYSVSEVLAKSEPEDSIPGYSPLASQSKSRNLDDASTTNGWISSGSRASREYSNMSGDPLYRLQNDRRMSVVERDPAGTVRGPDWGGSVKRKPLPAANSNDSYADSSVAYADSVNSSKFRGVNGEYKANAENPVISLQERKLKRAATTISTVLPHEDMTEATPRPISPNVRTLNTAKPSALPSIPSSSVVSGGDPRRQFTRNPRGADRSGYGE